jgi:hypothetical protein
MLPHSAAVEAEFPSRKNYVEAWAGASSVRISPASGLADLPQCRIKRRRVLIARQFPHHLAEPLDLRPGVGVAGLTAWHESPSAFALHAHAAAIAEHCRDGSIGERQRSFHVRADRAGDQSH